MSFFLQQQDVRNRERRRKLVRRWCKRMERWTLLVLGACGIVALAFGGYLAATVLPLFAATQVVVEGERRFLTDEAIRALAAIPASANIFQVPVATIERTLYAQPWAEEVAVRRKLPHTVWIYVGERIPAAILNLQGLYLVDEHGVIFKPLAPGDPADLPVLSGVSAVQVDADGFGHSAQVAAMLDLKERFERSGAGEQFGISEILLDRHGEWTIVTITPAMAVRIGTRFDPAQWTRLVHVAPAMPKRQFAAVDLRVDRKVIVR